MTEHFQDFPDDALNNVNQLELFVFLCVFSRPPTKATDVGEFLKHALSSFTFPP